MFSAATKTAAAAAGGYQISRSLRFNSADSTYLTRTPASASNRKTWTWSGWVKRSTLSTDQTLFEVFNGNNDNQTFNIAWNSSNLISIGAYNVFWLQTTPIYRDPSAWYHIVCAVDTTQATANNRIRIYVNGSEVTAFGTRNNPTQNDDLAINQAAAHYIGTRNAGSLWLNGYLTEVQFIDGQQLTPSSFGETNAQTGVWQPKAYSGSYGTNGFYLNFSDNSNTTAATLGKDYSGNGNNWTPNNFSVSAGSGNDSLVDVPTPYGVDTGAGGEVRGNYCTLNPLDNGGATVVNGNLDWDSGGNQGTRATYFFSSGKYYWELTNTESNLIGEHGVATANQTLTGGTAFPGAIATSWGFSNSSGNKSNNLTFTNIASAGAQNDVVMVAVDMDNGKIWWGRNGTWFGSGNPATGANAAFTNLSGNVVSPMTGVGGAAAGSVSYNFGQRPFAYTAPSGFNALCTQNLPTPAIGATTATQAGNYFSPIIYTGTGSTTSVTGLGFTPDFVWIKSRTNPSSGIFHSLMDTIRGATSGFFNVLYSNTTNSENNPGGSPNPGTTAGGVTAFTSGGFTLTPGSSDSQLNNNGTPYVAWNWKANGAGSTNTAGSITATVSANTTSGFSIATFTGTGALATVGHGLGVAPSMIIVKNRSTTTFWAVYHASLGNTQGIELNSTNAASTQTAYWNSTSPTSTVFTVNTDNRVNGSGNSMVAYCFAAVTGYSAFGTYTGNGNADGPFVFTGFRPRYVLIKASSSVSYGNWVLLDTSRSPSNVADENLYANLSNSEDGTYLVDILSNGFKLRSSAFDGTNGNGSTYIYAAFAEFPQKYSLAR